MKGVVVYQAFHTIMQYRQHDCLNAWAKNLSSQFRWAKKVHYPLSIFFDSAPISRVTSSYSKAFIKDGKGTFKCNKIWKCWMNANGEGMKKNFSFDKACFFFFSSLLKYFDKWGRLVTEECRKLIQNGKVL